MATTLSVGDIAIVQYNTSTDAFSFVFLRDVEAGTIVNFTDNGWRVAGGFRAGENTVTYTAPAAIAAGTTITLSGLDLDAAGDQIIAYQGDAATPTILHLADFADGNNTVAGDATDDSTTALPPGFTLGVNAVAVAFDSSLYAGPTSGSLDGLFAALNNSANWLDDDALPATLIVNAKPIIDLDADDSTHLGDDYEGSVVSGGLAVPISDTDVAIDDLDDFDILGAEIRVIGIDAGDLLAVNGSLPPGIVVLPFRTPDGILRLEGQASHAAYEAAIRQVVFSTTDAPGDLKRIQVSIFDGKSWSKNSTAFIEVTTNLTVAAPGLDLDANNSSGEGADAAATYTAGGQSMSVTDIDVFITADTTTIASATIRILGFSLHPGDLLSVAGSLPGGIAASTYSEITGDGVLTLSGPASLVDYQTALRQVVYSSTLAAPSAADRTIQVTVNDGALESNVATMFMHVAIPPPNLPPVLNLDANSSTTPGTNYLTGFTEGALPVAIVDTDVLAIDSDSPNLASATITLTNPQTGDVLTFDGTPPTGIDVLGSGTAQITLTGVTLSGSYQTALQQIKFSNTSIDPSNVTRSIEVVVSDGTSNSNTATAIVQVEAVNNSAPVIDLDPDDSGGSFRTTFQTIFAENGLPIPIADTDTTITDLDSPTLVFATITLANRQAGDLLAVTQTLPGGIFASAYNPGTGVLTLTGTATRDDYEKALQRVLYGNTSEDPATDDRLIEVLVNDGANTSNVAAAVIDVLAANDAPDIFFDASAAYVENAAVTPLAPLATLTDLDDAEFSEVVVRITDGAIPGDGDILSVDGLTSGTTNGITFHWNAAELALVFTGASLAENYQDLLRIVGFNSTSDNPTDFGARATRVLTWSISDGTAVTTTTTTIDILAVNDAPQAAVAATASYTENGAPVVLSPASIATDVDNITLVEGEVRIVSGAVDGDLLTVNGLQSGTFLGIEFSYDPVLRSLTFTHPSLVADYEAFLEAIAFSSTSDDPTNSGLDPTRTLAWFLFDGDAFSDVRTTVLSITALADAPVNTVPGAKSVNEDVTLPIAGVSVADVDTATLTTTLTVLNGRLHVTAGAGVSDNDTATVTITGTAAEINTALAGLSYTGDPNFNGSDTLTVTTGDGTAQDIDTVAITVNAVNDRPVLDLDVDNSSGAAGVDYTTTFTEGGAAVAVADLDDLVADVDNSTIASATITLANHQPADLLSVIGTLPTGITASAYDPSTGVLTLSGAATPAAYQAALRQISFGNSSPIPSATDRVVNIVVNDGTASSVAAHAFVHVVPVGTAPALDLDANDSSGVTGADYTAVFTGTAIPIADADTLVADADSANLLSATITLTNGEATDLLSVNGTLPTGITGAFDQPTGIFTLTGSAPLAAYQAALRQIEFGSSDPNPLTATRIIEVVVNDGTTDSSVASSLIQIAVAASLTLDLDADDSTASGSDYATTFTEDGGGVTIADVDITFSAPTLASATITLTNLLPGDLLSFGTLPDGVTAVYDPTTGVMRLTGAGLTANLQAASDQIFYSNNSENPATDHRIITVVVNDGASDSNIATAIVKVVAVNDPPLLSVSAAASYTENDSAVLVSPAAAVSDVDSPNLTIGIVAITGGLNPGDVLTVGGLRSGALGSIRFNWAPSLSELIVTGGGSPEQYEALFESVRFHSDSDDPTNGGADTTRTISWVVFDGTKTAISTTMLTVSDVNDAPVNVLPATQEIEANTATAIAGLSVSDADAGGGALTTTLSVTNGTLTVASVGGAAVTGSGTATVMLTGTLAEINSTLTAAGNVVYRGAQDFFGADTLTITTNDGGSSGTGGALTDTDQVAINLKTHLIGTPNDDNFTALPGNERIDALGSIDTVTFGFRLVDATVTYVGNKVIIDGPGGSHTVLTGFETYVFTDGTVNNNDGNWLLDDLFYYSQYHDVWNAGVDADEHYDTFGWHESRDPSAFFSTMIYLSAYPDVAVAGVNPLDHWHEFGWTEGRVPSLDFGPREYLSAYPDVEAAHVDPLEHFLLFGAGELREPFPPGELVTGNGFDYVYYLQHNPDVAAAGVDPFAHFQAFGWREGRDPNALFDVSGYLATYTDVAAANVNPLDHYNQFGWHEGRDPSVDFDTTSYLAAYPDVAAAGTNPLTHFLQFGDDESRSPFSDGVWH